MSSFQPERITQCLSNIESDSDETQERALRALTSLTKVNPQNRAFLARSDGAVPALLALAKSPSSGLAQILSLAVLFNLSLNPELKPSLATMKTIALLNSIIASPAAAPEPGRLASSLLCSLAMLDKNKARFGAAGTVRLLVVSASEPHPGPASHHLLSALAELVHFHGNATVAVRSGAVPVLLRAASGDLAGPSLAVLARLARFDEGLRALRNTDRAVEKMVGVLRGSCVVSKEGAAEILVRLFDDSEGCVRDALRLPDFMATLADLSVRGSAKARENASALMKKVVEADSDVYVEESPLFSFPVGIEF